jgi:hypothetical protein
MPAVGQASLTIDGELFLDALIFLQDFDSSQGKARIYCVR